MDGVLHVNSEVGVLLVMPAVGDRLKLTTTSSVDDVQTPLLIVHLKV
jgi:hypothetical protein